MYSGKVVIFGQNRLYSRKKLVVFGQSGCIREEWLYSFKVLVILQSGCILAKVVVIRLKLFYSGKKVLFGQK